MKKIFLFIFVSLFFCSCSQPRLFKETRIAMDTFVEISYYASEAREMSDAIKDAFREIERIEGIFNKFNNESEVSNINRLAGTEDVNISPEVFGLMARAVDYSRLTNGSFDITVEPLKKGRYEKISLDKERLSVRFLEEGMKIDLGGIAKGYAVDRVKEILLSRGVSNALINIGGNIYALGSPPRKESWKIGIQSPENKKEIVYKLDLKDRAISTSGSYERGPHIIDPANGKPAEDIVSVTVIARSAEEADALSTAVFVMGEEKGSRLIESLKNTEVLIIDTDSNFTFQQR